MKKALLISLVFISISVYSQVGIGTTSPTAQLDVKGDFKVRTTALNSGLLSAQDSVLVVNAGVVNRVTSKQIYDSHIKSFVKGNSASATTLGLSIGSTGYKRIPFSSETLDENNDYNPAVYEFTAPKAGIYCVYLQSNLYTAVSLSASVGIAIFTDRAGTVAIEADQTFAGLGLLSTTASSTQSLVKLNANDKIFFGASSSLSLSVVGSSKSFFTIMQVE